MRQPYVSVKSNQGIDDNVLWSILASLKDALVKNQIESQSKNESKDAASPPALQKGRNNFEVQDKSIQEANSAEGSEEQETE